MNKNKIDYTDTFLKEKESLIEQFGYFFGSDFEKIISWIQRNPAPPGTHEWHKIKERCNDKMIVGAYAITKYDQKVKDEEYIRIVYEYYPENKKILFKNCIGHKDGDYTYSSSTLDILRFFSNPYQRAIVVNELTKEIVEEIRKRI